MAHRVLDQRLNHKRRMSSSSAVLVHVDRSPARGPRQARLLEREVAQRLRDLALDGDELAGVLERRAIELGELAQQLARAQRSVRVNEAMVFSVLKGMRLICACRARTSPAR